MRYTLGAASTVARSASGVIAATISAPRTIRSVFSTSDFAMSRSAMVAKLRSSRLRARANSESTISSEKTRYESGAFGTTSIPMIPRPPASSGTPR